MLPRVHNVATNREYAAPWVCAAKTLCVLVLALGLLLPVGWMPAAMAAQSHNAQPTRNRHKGVPVHVVYHLDAGAKGTMTALHQIKNQLAVQPHAKIVAVAIGKSVPYFTRTAMTAGGYPFKLMVQVLQQKGVRFEACGNTMKMLKIAAIQLDDGVVVVPSGMAELARLQWREGYVYLKP